VLQASALRAQLLLLARSQARGVELSDLEAQEILTLQRGSRPAPRAARAPHALVCLAYSVAKRSRNGSASANDRAGQLAGGLEQPLVLVLAVNLDERVAQSLEETDRYRGVV